MIYLDYNATTPLVPEAREAMLPFLGEHFGNPSSIHAAGREARAAIDSARDRIAHLLGAKPHEIVFTGGGTESVNLAVLGLARAGKGRHIITSATEHHAVLHACEYLAKHEGFRLTILPVDRHGVLAPEQVVEAIAPDTALVSVMTANNETGTLQPVKTIAARCRERGVLFHTDDIQGFGKLPLSAEGVEPQTVTQFDACSIAAHKFYGPKGVGVLYLRSGLPLVSLQHGGSHENQRRPGTENVAAIAGMAVAAGWVKDSTKVRDESLRLLELRERLWAGIQSAFPTAIRNGHPDACLPNTLNVSFPGLDGEGLLMALDLAGIAVSSGSACMVGSVQPSHVLLAMGVAPEIASATVRFSLGKPTTEREIDEAISRLAGVFQRLSATAAL